MFVFPATLSTSSRRAASDLARARLFDHLWVERNTPAAPSPRVPAIDVAETDTTYRLSFEVPGLTREQLKVSVLGRRVQLETVDATPAPEAAEKALDAAERWLYRERTTPQYARTVSLPAEVDQTNAVAKYDNGVLTLTLNKKVAAGVTHLSIG